MTSTTHRPDAVDREVAATVIVFAPSDADSDYLTMQPDIAALRDEDRSGEVEVLEVFEGMEVPNSDCVVDPERAAELRTRYGVPTGTVTVLVLSPGDQQPVTRIDGAADRDQLHAAVERTRATC